MRTHIPDFLICSFLALILSGCVGHNPESDATATQTFATLVPTSVDDTSNFAAFLSERAAHFDVSRVSVTLSTDLTGPLTLSNSSNSQNGVFQAASLSKAVAAAGILIIMEGEGIALDSDIRDHFVRLDIREIEGGDQPLTIRELLSHTAGANQSGYPGYRRDTALPTSLEVVTNPPHPFVSPVHLKGEKGRFSYSGGGYMIAQILVEDITGEPFTDLMQSVLLDPLGMTRSRFDQPIDPAGPIGRHIVPAHSERRFNEGLFRPLKEDWLIYPEQAAAGLWTTSPDYARFIDAILKAYSGKHSPIPATVAKAMLTSVDADYGLGVMIDYSDGQPRRFWHSGLNAGYRALFSASLENGHYAVSLTNGSGGAALNEEIIHGVMSAALSSSPADAPNAPSGP